MNDVQIHQSFPLPPFYAIWYYVVRNYTLCDCTCLVDYKVTKSFNFARKNHLPFYFVSASDGIDVVKVSVNWNSYLYNIVICVARYLKKQLKQQLLTRNTLQIS